MSILRNSSTDLPPDPPDIQPADSDLPSDCSAPTEKIQNSLKQLRNGKAGGPDNIPAEALKVDIRTNVGLRMLYPLFKKIREEEWVPTEWKEGYLIKLLLQLQKYNTAVHSGKGL